MQSLEQLKSVSQLIRKSVFLILSVFVLILLYGYWTEGRWWLTIGDEQFTELWRTYPDAQMALSFVQLPIIAALIAGLFWFQKLLYRFGKGEFFSDSAMYCLKWLAWLTLFVVVYGMFWPVIVLMAIDDQAGVIIRIRPMTILATAGLPLVIHLLSAARELHQDNSEII